MLDVRWAVGKSRRGVCWIYVVFLNTSFWCFFGEAALFSLKVSALMRSGPSWRILLVRLGAGRDMSSYPSYPPWNASTAPPTVALEAQAAWQSCVDQLQEYIESCGCFDIWWCWVMSQRGWCSWILVYRMYSRITCHIYCTYMRTSTIDCSLRMHTQHRCAGICRLHLRLMHLRISNSPPSNSSPSRITQTFFPAVVQENLMNEFGVPGVALVACGVLSVLSACFHGFSWWHFMEISKMLHSKCQKTNSFDLPKKSGWMDGCWVSFFQVGIFKPPLSDNQVTRHPGDFFPARISCGRVCPSLWSKGQDYWREWTRGKDKLNIRVCQ